MPQCREGVSSSYFLNSDCIQNLRTENLELFSTQVKSCPLILTEWKNVVPCDFTSNNTAELMKRHRNLSNTMLPLCHHMNIENINPDELLEVLRLNSNSILPSSFKCNRISGISPPWTHKQQTKYKTSLKEQDCGIPICYFLYTWWFFLPIILFPFHKILSSLFYTVLYCG